MQEFIQFRKQLPFIIGQLKVIQLIMLANPFLDCLADNEFMSYMIHVSCQQLTSWRISERWIMAWVEFQRVMTSRRTINIPISRCFCNGSSSSGAFFPPHTRLAMRLKEDRRWGEPHNLVQMVRIWKNINCTILWIFFITVTYLLDSACRLFTSIRIRTLLAFNRC